MSFYLKEKTLLFKILIGLDRLFNVITGGSFQECFSTRAHLKAVLTNTNKWIFIRDAVDYLFWKGHCKDSFIWEMDLKSKYLKAYNNLYKEVN